MRFAALSLVVALLMTGCAREETPDTTDAADAAKDSDRAATVLRPTFSEERLHDHIRILASDEFEGRAPSTPGEEKTLAYLVKQFGEIGLEPGNGDSYLQPVPLVSIQADTDMVLEIKGDGTDIKLAGRDDMTAWTKRVTDATSIEDSEVVFVGYGVVAPEYGWNDYEGLDVEGHTVIILVNDPGYATQNPELFTGNEMTYYGRWTYKYAEAARQGAAGAFIVHETAPASYPWGVVAANYGRPRFDLVTEDKNFSRVPVEGWITHEAAQEVFSAAGLHYETEKEKAASADFKPVPLGLTASIAVQNTLEESVSQNVVGVLRGSERPDETIVFTAHWDHLGKNDELEGDTIYNGAVDNASGTAALIELALAFAELPERPKRSIVFLAVTAEEQGLLGSRHYANNPTESLPKMVASLNMDSANVYGETNDVQVIGWNFSELQDYVDEAAAIQDRITVQEPTPEAGYYYRSDHFNFAKVGVPSLYAEGGDDLKNGGKEAGRAAAKDYRANRYHKPADEYDESWDLSGMTQDMELDFLIANKLANEDTFTNWRETSEFRAIRDASRANMQ